MDTITASISSGVTPAFSIASLPAITPISANIDNSSISLAGISGFIKFGSRAWSFSITYRCFIPDAFSTNSDEEGESSSIEPAAISLAFSVLNFSTYAL